MKKRRETKESNVLPEWLAWNRPSWLMLYSNLMRQHCSPRRQQRRQRHRIKDSNAFIELPSGMMDDNTQNSTYANCFFFFLQYFIYLFFLYSGNPFQYGIFIRFRILRVLAGSLKSTGKKKKNVKPIMDDMCCLVNILCHTNNYCI